MIRAVLIDQSNNIIQAINLADDWNQVPQGNPHYYAPPQGLTVVIEPNAGIGWSYNGSTFTPPPANPVVSTAPPIQGPVSRLVSQLQAAGTLSPAQVSALNIPFTS